MEAERLTEKPAWLCHAKAELLWMEKTKRWKKQILEVISTAAGGSLIVTEGWKWETSRLLLPLRALGDNNGLNHSQQLCASPYLSSEEQLVLSEQ